MGDFLVVLWKEWKELRQQGVFNLAIGALNAWIVFGWILPWSDGGRLLNSPMTPICWIWTGLFFTAMLMPESFAGERERKTLESLLATRLPDSAILFGKIGCAVSYSMGIILIGILITVLRSTLRDVHRTLELHVIASSVGLGFLAAVLAGAGGALLSLRAQTVRQVRITLGYAALIGVFGTVALLKALPWTKPALRWLATVSPTVVEALSGAVFLVLALVTVTVAETRFERARLTV